MFVVHVNIMYKMITLKNNLVFIDLKLIALKKLFDTHGSFIRDNVNHFLKLVKN